MARASEAVYDAEFALARAVRRALVDPTWYVNHVLGIKLDEWQAELMEAIADLYRAKVGIETMVNHDARNRFTISAGHGPGKTYLFAVIMHYVGFTRRAQMPCTSSKEKQITTRLWPRFRHIRRNAKMPGYGELIDIRESKIVWCGDPNWAAIPEAASDPENLAGYHPSGEDDWVVYFVDEASGVNANVFPAIQGVLASANTAMLLGGNPTQNTGEFYESHNRAAVKKLYFTRTGIDPSESSYVDRRWVDEMIERYGADSPVVQVRVYGRFATLSERQIVALEWLEDARLRSEVDDGSFSRLRVSVDVADGGTDETVITAARHWDTHVHVLRQQRFSFPAHESPILAAEAAVRMFDAYDGKTSEGDDFVVDSVGVGTTTAGLLMRDERGFSVMPYKGGSASSNPKRWRNKRTQTILAARDFLRDGRVSIADDFSEDDRHWHEFTAQVCALRYPERMDKVDDVETKEVLLKRILKSPDLAESFFFQFADSTPPLDDSKVLAEVVGASEMEGYDAGLT